MNTIPVCPVEDAKREARGSSSPAIPRLQTGDTPPGEAQSVGLIECPMQTAMRQVAEAAVTQHVLYAEGVYRPREGLLHEMQAWLRLHELVRTGICPATRASGDTALEPGDLEIALAGLPVEMRTKVATSVRVCGRRGRGEGCPLDAQPPDDLIE